LIPEILAASVRKGEDSVSRHERKGRDEADSVLILIPDKDRD